MALDSVHPDYSEHEPDWALMVDSYLGERRIKEKGTDYLPATTGQIRAGQGKSTKSNVLTEGDKMYNAYRDRALYLDFVTAAVNAMVGVMHREPPNIELPAKMEPMRERVTIDGEGLELLLRRINLNQLREGRFGLLLEAPDGRGPGALPYAVTYRAMAIRNWDVGAREQGTEETELVVLDESRYVRGVNLEWVWRQKWRVLSRAGDIASGLTEPRAAGPYMVAALTETNSPPPPNAEAWIAPEIAGRRLDVIPWTFVNALDLCSSPSQPPLLGLADLCLAIYRGDADYRLNLHMQAQDTLVAVGRSDAARKEETPIGAGAILDVPRDGDAKYIGVSSAGLGEQRMGQENLIAQAEQRALQMMDGRSRQRESGSALSIRMAGATSTLHQVARTGAEALQNMLRQAAVWVGANPEDVTVEANTDFVEEDFQTVTKAIADLIKAKSGGFPVSQESMHRIARQKDLTVFTFEEEKEKLEEEALDMPPAPRRDLDPPAPDDPPEPEPEPEE